MNKKIRELLEIRHTNRFSRFLQKTIQPAKQKHPVYIGFASAMIAAILISAGAVSHVTAAALPSNEAEPAVTAIAADTVLSDSSAQLTDSISDSARLLTPALPADLELNISDEAELELQIKNNPVNAQKSLRTAGILALLHAAEQQLGIPYVFASAGPETFDCSGLVYYCLNKAGISIDRTTAAGYSTNSDWEKISSMDDLQAGDILFFSIGEESVGHTAIYAGNGEMIDASVSNGEVIKRSCTTSYWTSNFVFARRPF